MVETQGRLVFDNLPLRNLHPRRRIEPHQGKNERNPEEESEIVGRVIDIDACRRGDSHGQVVAQPIEADSLIASRRGEHVNRHRAVGNRRRPERDTVDCAHDGEHQQRRRPYVAGETYEEGEEAEHQHLLTVETVYHKAAERPNKQRSHDIAREYEANHILFSLKLLVEINGQKRREEIKGEEKQEIACHHLDILPVPELFRSPGRFLRPYSRRAGADNIFRKSVHDPNE